MRFIFYIFLVAFVIIVESCTNNAYENETIIYNVVDISMHDLGQISTDLSFDIYPDSTTNTHICHIKTNTIKIDDRIDRILVSSTEKTIQINISTFPNSSDCKELSCYSTHDLRFSIVGLNDGDYNITWGVNNVYNKPLNFHVNKIY